MIRVQLWVRLKIIYWCGCSSQISVGASPAAIAVQKFYFGAGAGVGENKDCDVVAGAGEV